MSPTAQPDGLLFGPTENGKSYLSCYDHRGRNSTKGRWHEDVSPPDEYVIFSRSDDEDWYDSAGHYWGIRDAKGLTLGARGERLAKFPSNAVAAVPWHGYPVSPAAGRASEVPPDDFVDRLIQAGAISRTFGRKIQRRKA